MKPNPFLSELDGVLHDGLKFCSIVYALFEKVRQTEDGKIRLRMRASSLEKRLIEELLPICKYIQLRYRAGRYISVQWINGSQQFDAELLQSGGLVDKECFSAKGYLEVTCVMHPNEYLIREQLTKTGFAYSPDGIKRLRNKEIVSEPVVYSNQDFVHKYAKLVVSQIKKKTNINYPENTALIVQCSLNSLYHTEDWKLLTEEVSKSLPAHLFNEIIIYDEVSERSCML